MDEITCGVAAATLASYEAAEELERRQSDTSEFQMAVENLARAFCDSSAAFEEMAAFAETSREVLSCIGGDGRRLKRRKKICRSSPAPFSVAGCRQAYAFLPDHRMRPYHCRSNC